MQEENVELSKRIRTLENRTLRTNNDGISYRLEALEREKLSQEIIIFGVKERPGEKIKTTINEIGNTVSVITSSVQITECYQISGKGEHPRPIIVKFSSREIRNEWIERKRSKGKLTGGEISQDLSDND